MLEKDWILGQVVKVVSEIPQGGLGTVKVFRGNKRVVMAAKSHNSLPIHAGTPVVVQDISDGHILSVSVNLPTPS